MIHEYKICRTFYALRLLFSEEDLKELEIDVKLEHGKTLFPHMLQLVQKDGIVVAETERSVVFVHQTFAEYLAAEWLAENVRNEHKDTAKNLLKVTFDPNLKVVRNIFDRILAKNCPLHLAIINFQVDKVANLIDSNHWEDLDDGNRNFLHVLASWGLHHAKKRIEAEPFELKKMSREDEMIEILKLIPDPKLNDSRDHILEYTPIDYAIISFSLYIANALCEKMKSSRIYIDLEDDEVNLVLLYCYKMDYLSLIRKIINHRSIDSKLFIDKEDRDSLSFIISKGNTKKLKLLISEGRNLNEKDKFGSVPIHIAVRLEKEEMVKILIHNGVHTNAMDSTGKTPLHWSVLQGLLSILKLLIANGADINIVDDQTRTALHYAVISYPQHQLEIISALSNANLEILDVNDMTPFLWAAHYGNTECINSFLKLGVDIEQKNRKEITALLWAAGNGHIDTVDLLLSKGANANAKSVNGTTPLIFAARYGYTNVVNLLLDRAADIESRDHDDMSALYWAAHGGHYDIASLLIKSKANIITETGVNALCAASRYGHKDVVELFLSHGANIESIDDEKKTPLVWAASNGHTDIVKFLLSKGANINAQDNLGNNALHWATRHGFTQVVKLLLSKGSEIPKNSLHIAADRGHSDLINMFLFKDMDVNSKDEIGMTPLHYAARVGCKKSVALLLIKGADIEARNSENQAPLILAVKEDHKEVTNLLLTEGANIETRTNKNETPLIVAARYNRNKKITSLLLSEGARIKSKDDEGRLALHWAVYNPNMVQEIVKLLLSKSLEMIETRTAKQETPLILAAQNSSTGIIKFLLSKKVDLEAKDCNGMNSLHWAAVKGRLKVVSLLLSHKADLEAKDNENKTALIFAAQNGHTSVIRLLLSSGAHVRAKDKNGLTALNWAKNCNQEDVVMVLKSANRFTVEASGYLLIKAHADCSDGLYRLEANGSKYLANAVYIDQEELWHKRLAHLNRRSMTILKNKMVTGREYNGGGNPCVPCINGKQTRTPFNKSKKGNRASKVLELIHSDLCGPIEKSCSGARYLLTFIDDFIRKTFGYVLKNKSEVFEKFKHWKVLGPTMVTSTEIKSLQIIWVDTA
ncbi:hypothetical protein ILUMI_18233 [Ignelater luminosus]|uniref:GAG-pre-integrase domain-containing protein n=1 Tax=Ignelater luminosus TaxID=2038154 RepID=A0A8K0G6R9_IGNLU|nr:hypothetical protein ILUMI_18233 [Ignelater luminosus]